MKKVKKTRVPGKGHTIPAKEEGGIVAEALAQASQFKKQSKYSKKLEG